MNKNSLGSTFSFIALLLLFMFASAALASRSINLPPKTVIFSKQGCRAFQLQQGILASRLKSIETGGCFIKSVKLVNYDWDYYAIELDNETTVFRKDLLEAWSVVGRESQKSQ